MLTWFLTVMYFVTAQAYWGEIPATRQSVSVTELQNEQYSVALTLQSFLTHHIQLDLTLSSIAPLHISYDVEGSERTQRKSLAQCQFQGTVRGVAESMVVMSNCSGFFRGSITQGSTITYLARENDRSVVFLDSDLPVRYVRFDYSTPTPSNQHVDYSTPSNVDTTLLINVETSQSDHIRFKREEPAVPPVLSWPKKTLEVVVATDKALWMKYDRNVTMLEEYVLATVNAIDAIYRRYNIRVALMGVENWRGRDEIQVTESYSFTLRNFTGYRQDQLLKLFRGHDVSILMTGVDFKDQIVGYAGVGTMCRSSSTNVNYDSRSNPLFYATVIAHELGHNLGMYHDSIDCKCDPDTRCIMAPSLSSPVSRFSDCSQSVLKDFKGKCLDNHPTKLYTEPICGNGFVEQGEECDCGTEEECLATDPCCEAIGCKLKVDSECYTGDCCTECKFKSYKKICREQTSECDLEEYCTGTNAECPVNRFRQEGANCALNNTGYCMYGSCQTHDRQCAVTYGEGSSKASDECYTRYNRGGTWYGNCGSLGMDIFLKCSNNDIMCGTAYCNTPGDPVSRIRGTSNYTLPLDSGGKCSLVYNIQGSENADIGMVYDGTKCGEKSWCKGGYCTEFEKPSCPKPGGTECAGFGQCNDLNQCHCYAGYDPEYNCSILLKVAGWNLRNILICVLVIALVVLPVITMTIILMRKHNPTCNKFFSDYTDIRFSVHLASISRTASYVRRSSMRRRQQSKKPKARPASDSLVPGSKRPSADPRSRASTYGGPPARPAPPSVGPTRPPPPVIQPPLAKPAPWRSYTRHISEEGPPAEAKPGYAPIRPAPSEPAASSAITPARPAPMAPPDPLSSNITPARRAPGVPSESDRRASSNITPQTSPVKSGPRLLKDTKDNIKMDISGPEFPRSLMDDSPLDERRLAGSPLLPLNNVQR